MVMKRSIKKSSAQKTTKGTEKPTTGKKQKVLVVQVSVAGGPYPNATAAKAAKAQASKIPKVITGPIKKEGKAYTFQIIQRFGARTQAEKEKLVKLIHAKRNEHGVHSSRVKVSSKTVMV